MTLFCDTSALAKRYVAEVGSLWMEQLLAPEAGNDVVISRITVVELKSALARRERGGSLTLENATIALQRLWLHCAHDYLIVRLQDSHYAKAELLATQYGLRAYDAMQLAVGVAVQLQFKPQGYLFVSADDELNKAASAEGLTVENPNHHP